MKTTNRIMTILLAMALVAVSSAASRAESCHLAKQLEDPGMRSLYEARINEARENEESVFGGTVRFSTEFVFANGDRQLVDSFSSDCMACHDGLNATYHDVRIRNGKRQGAISLANVLGSHPIGMHYGSMAYENTTLRPVETLDRKIVLADGLVGCLSCHDMLNPSPFHLVMENEGSRLCLQCHGF